MPRSIDLRTLEAHLSVERLAPYRAATPDERTAVRLYEWNARITGALWQTIGHVEVLIRNAMHNELTRWSTVVHTAPRWYLDRGQLLNWRARDEIRNARQRAIATGRPELPGRVVAELGLGFWRYLAASGYDRSLWRTCLHSAFPGRPRRDVYEALRQLHHARNRCAHHEPMHNRPVHQLHEMALVVAGW